MFQRDTDLPVKAGAILNETGVSLHDLGTTFNKGSTTFKF